MNKFICRQCGTDQYSSCELEDKPCIECKSRDVKKVDFGEVISDDKNTA